jgi:hypothetical protein
MTIWQLENEKCPLLLADFCFALYLSGVREAAIFTTNAFFTATGGSP